ncbi:MAG: PIN domain-containing protein [Acidimicrobiia bacterium]|nr:PIN domain-containing protein [Acidimicrobiia bacterium]
MTYADTDFFLALMKKSDWLKSAAERLLVEHERQLWTSPATLIELPWLAKRRDLDAMRLLTSVLRLVELRGSGPAPLQAAEYSKSKDVEALDALHAAFCDKDKIISSDQVFDRLGLDRVPLGA